MDTNIQKALTDKLYDRRKAGAFEYAPSIAMFLARKPKRAADALC
jgi:hypothetical protein